VLKNVHAICTEEVYNALVECEKAAKHQMTKARKRQSKCTKDVSSSEEDKEDNVESELEGSVEIQDCIVVRPQ
jgi:hypothetical protein